MATVRPSALPAAASVTAGGALVVDTGSAVEKATPLQVVDAAIPLASQADAEAGTDNAKRVTPLRVAQAIDALGVNGAALADTDGGTLVGFQQTGTGTAARSADAKLREVRTLEDFGAVGYNTYAAAAAGTDSSTAIQAAINWAYNGGASSRGLRVTANFFQCGNITLRNGTTLIGSGRQVSGFVAKAGTTGKWFTADNAQKVTLKDLCFYANSITTITHIVDLDTAQAGTEGFVSGCWFRDAPYGYGIYCNGNAYYLINNTAQTCKWPFWLKGEGNKFVSGTSMQAGKDADVPADAVGFYAEGWDVTDLHLEAPESLATPIQCTGNTHFSGLSYSPGLATSIECFAEIDTTNHTDYSIIGLHIINPGRVTVTGGCFKVAGNYQYGTTITNIQGLAHLGSISNTRSPNGLMIRRRRFQAFRLRIMNNGGVIQARIGSPGDSSIAAPQADRITGATTAYNTIAATFQGGIAGFAASGNGHQIAFDTADQNPAGEADYQLSLFAKIEGNTTGAAAPIVSFANFTTTVSAVARWRPLLQFLAPTDTTNKWLLDTTNIPAGKFIDVQVWAWLL